MDNGSTKDKEKIENLINKYSFLTIIYNDTNLGYSIANNQGARSAVGKYLCFLNSDTEVGKNWLEDLYLTLEDSKAGAVGPLGNPKLILEGDIYYNYTQYIGQYKYDTEVETLIGFCILMEKSLFNQICGWDEDFEIGNFEDTFLCEKIKYRGYSLYISAKANVKHLNPSRTFRENNLNWDKTMERNGQLFVRKLKDLKLINL